MFQQATADLLSRRVGTNLKSLFKSSKGTRPPDYDTMLNYFISQLVVRTKLVGPRVVGDPQKEVLLDEICTKLNGFLESHANMRPASADEAWNEAYYLERLLALVEPKDTLIGEVQRRLDEAVEEKVPGAPRLRTIYDAVASQILDITQSPPVIKKDCEHRMRSMLLDILEEIHWTFQRKFHSRPIQKSATRRLVSTGLVACGLFILPYAYIYIRSWISDTNYILPLDNWAWLPLWSPNGRILWGNV